MGSDTSWNESQTYNQVNRKTYVNIATCRLYAERVMVTQN